MRQIEGYLLHLLILEKEEAIFKAKSDADRYLCFGAIRSFLQ